MEQIWKTMEEVLYPRLALFEALAHYKGEHERRRPASNVSDEACEIRRDFLDSFAYLCDIRTGGSTVTAAALQELPHSNFLWLAANEGIQDRVHAFAEFVLERLKKMNSETEPMVREEIFQEAVQISSDRLGFYRNELQTYARNCRMDLRRKLPDDTVTALRRKLKKLSEPPNHFTPAHIVDFCYEMRGRDVDAIKNQSIRPQDDYVKLAHYIGRLGATRSSVDAAVKAMSRVPSLRRISEIRYAPAPEPKSIQLSAESMSPYEIVRAISKDSTSQNIIDIHNALHSLIRLDLPSSGDSVNPIRAKMAQRSILTRVHAELQICDQFSRRGFNFVGGDKYIGCSKPACYFCYNWLVSHRHNYVHPATHNKIITGCRGPASNLNESGVTILKEMYSKVNRQLGQDIIDFLLHVGEDEARGRRQYMSTEGTSRATSIV
ncbi:hypothetical protein BGZ63DRAFT_417121 [Mariannaea sp. PMI_226]|nr:hypothetical protein BGZ63DRAFT_417121 [Mariannaea sp. PMI_226]